MVDYANPSRGTVAYRRDYATPTSLQTRQARDSNFAFYVPGQLEAHASADHEYRDAV